MTERVCTVDGCGRKHKARGLCQTHYDQLRTAGLVNEAVCTIEGCERALRCKGLCFMHYGRLRRFGAVGEAATRFEHNHPAVCTVEGCEREYVTRGLCHMHWDRLRRSGAVGSPFTKQRCGCVVCDHPEVEEIDARLRRRREPGLGRERGPWLDYGLTSAQIGHHRRAHLDNEQYYARAAAEAVKLLNEARAAVRA